MEQVFLHYWEKKRGTGTLAVVNHRETWPIHRTAVMEYSVRMLRHSGLMLAARITCPHFSVSAAISLPKSAGVPKIAVPPKSASRAFILRSARAALISLLSLSTI